MARRHPPLPPPPGCLDWRRLTDDLVRGLLRSLCGGDPESPHYHLLLTFYKKEECDGLTAVEYMECCRDEIQPAAFSRRLVRETRRLETLFDSGPGRVCNFEILLAQAGTKTSTYFFLLLVPREDSELLTRLLPEETRRLTCILDRPSALLRPSTLQAIGARLPPDTDGPPEPAGQKAKPAGKARQPRRRRVR